MELNNLNALLNTSCNLVQSLKPIYMYMYTAVLLSPDVLAPRTSVVYVAPSIKVFIHYSFIYLAATLIATLIA